jgi:hypothetical protein
MGKDAVRQIRVTYYGGVTAPIGLHSPVSHECVNGGRTDGMLKYSINNRNIRKRQLTVNGLHGVISSFQRLLTSGVKC